MNRIVLPTIVMLALFAANSKADLVYISTNDASPVYYNSALANPPAMATPISGFSAPMTFNSTGTLYAISNGNVTRFSSTGTPTYLGSPAGVTGLVVDNSGNVYVTSTGNGGGNNTVVKITPGGVSSVFASGISDPSAIAIDASGNIYVATQFADTILKFTPGGVMSQFANTGLNEPAGMAFDKQGNLYVSNFSPTGSNIVKFTPNGTESVFSNSTQLNLPLGLAFDSSGTLWVANTGGDNILEIAPSGSSVAVFTTSSGVAGRPDFVAIPAAVPESSSFILVGLALIVILLGLRRGRWVAA